MRNLLRSIWRSSETSLSFHDWMVETGRRAKTFHASKRAAREANGLRATSSDMHHLHGSRI